MVDLFRTRRQLRHARGFQGGSLLADRAWAFWTMTAWDSQDSMRHYMRTGPHKVSMPHLLEWCDEASVVHWDQPGGDEPGGHQPGETLPSWTEADRRMRQDGRPSKVRNPGPRHADLTFPAPRTVTARPVWPVRPR